MLAYLLERAPTVEPLRHGTAAASWLRGVTPAFAAARPSPWTALPGPRWAAALVLARLADGEAAGEMCGELGLGDEVFTAALRDVARRSRTSEPRAQLFRWLAEGGRLDERAATELGLTLEQLRSELEPTDELLDTVSAAIVARSAVPGPPSEYLGTSPQGPLRTMPVRFPEAQYERLRAWAEGHNFPMAVVVRGLVERFLDEQQRRAA